MSNTIQSLKNATMALIKRFRALEAEQRDLDYRRSEWARDLRALCASDDKFTRWCADELGLTATQAGELLARAATIAAIPDVNTWNANGGFQKLRKVAELPKKEQVAVVQAAKASGYAISTVLKQRGHVASALPAATVPTGPAADAAAFAEYVRGLQASDARIVVPREIRALLRRYPAAAAALKVAA